MWDGSYIGKLNRSDADIYRLNGRNYWVFYLENRTIACTVSYSSNNLQCVLDELKSDFCISKTGTHSCHINNRYAVICRVPMEDNKLIMDTPLSKVKGDVEEGDYDEIRKVIIFREMLGILGTTNSSVVIKHINGSNCIASVREREMGINTNSIIPTSMWEEWFGESLVSEHFLRLYNIERREEVDKFAARISRRFVEECNRLGCDAVWRENIIRMRIKTRATYNT